MAMGMDELLQHMKLANEDTDPFAKIYKDAKAYNDAVQRGDKERLEKFNFSVGPMVSCYDARSPAGQLADCRVYSSGPFGWNTTQCSRCSKPCMDLVSMKWKARSACYYKSNGLTERNLLGTCSH